MTDFATYELFTGVSLRVSLLRFDVVPGERSAAPSSIRNPHARSRISANLVQTMANSGTYERLSFISHVSCHGLRRTRTRMAPGSARHATRSPAYLPARVWNRVASGRITSTRSCSSHPNAPCPWTLHTHDASPGSVSATENAPRIARSAHMRDDTSESIRTKENTLRIVYSAHTYDGTSAPHARKRAAQPDDCTAPACAFAEGRTERSGAA